MAPMIMMNRCTTVCRLAVAHDKGCPWMAVNHATLATKALTTGNAHGFPPSAQDATLQSRRISQDTADDDTALDAILGTKMTISQPALVDHSQNHHPLSTKIPNTSLNDGVLLATRRLPAPRTIDRAASRSEIHHPISSLPGESAAEALGGIGGDSMMGYGTILTVTFMLATVMCADRGRWSLGMAISIPSLGGRGRAGALGISRD